MVTTNILIVDQALEFGGSIVSTSNLIRGMDRNRFKVVFLSSTNRDLIRNKLREVADDTEVVIARKKLHYNNLRKFLPRARRCPIKTVRLLSTALLYGIRLLANSGYMVALAKTIRKHNIQLVQLNNGIDDEVAIVCKLLGVKQLVYLRGYILARNIQKTLFVPSVQYFLAVSEFVRQEAINDGMEPGKVVVATPPVIPEPVAPNTIKQLKMRYGVQVREQCVGVFGRIIRWKGQKQLLLAARQMLAVNPHVKFFIIGDTTDGATAYRKELADIIESSGMKSQVVFTGYIDNVYDYYELMDIVVHTSIEPEPSGRVIFEAMSQGKPVVASIHGGPTEFIEHGKDGFLVDPLDVDALAARITQLLERKSLAKQFGIAGKTKMNRLYSKERYAVQIANYYEQAMTTGSRKLAPGRQITTTSERDSVSRESV